MPLEIDESSLPPDWCDKLTVGRAADGRITRVELAGGGPIVQLTGDHLEPTGVQDHRRVVLELRPDGYTLTESREIRLGGDEDGAELGREVLALLGRLAEQGLSCMACGHVGADRLTVSMGGRAYLCAACVRECATILDEAGSADDRP